MPICGVWCKDESETREDKIRFSRIRRGVSRPQLSVMIASPGPQRSSNDSYSPAISIAGRAWTDVRDPSWSLNSCRILEFRYFYSPSLSLCHSLIYRWSSRILSLSGIIAILLYFPSITVIVLKCLFSIYLFVLSNLWSFVFFKFYMDYFPIFILYKLFLFNYF